MTSLWPRGDSALGLGTNPCKVNKQWVWEVYSNLSIVSLLDTSSMTIWIGGKVVEFGARKINDLYEIPNENMANFEAKGCELGSWLAERLCPSKEVSWVATKINISMNDFTAESWI